MVGVFCDLTRAFDCVNHGLLLRKLENCGVKDSILKWLETYLYNRKQRVVLRTCNSVTAISEWRTSRYGVPQGSILGPLLFNVYINDFPSILRNIAHTILYADDTTIIITSNDLNILNDKINTVMKRISIWF